MSVTRVADRWTRKDEELLTGQSLIVAVTIPAGTGKGARINIVQGLTLAQLTQLKATVVAAFDAEIERVHGIEHEQRKGAKA